MLILLFAIFTQSLTFLPLALGISVSYNILRATDMTIDSSFVLGAGIFARLVTLGYSPLISALASITTGALAGIMTATIQRNGKVDSLLAGVLATFILTSLSLVLMGRPNISLLTETTLISAVFNRNEYYGWMLVAAYVLLLCGSAYLLLSTRYGLMLKGFGDNPSLMQRLGKNIEFYRASGFALTNALAAGSGCLTAQTVGYADLNMGLGMTLTGIGTIMLGQQLLKKIFDTTTYFMEKSLLACLIGVLTYFAMLNLLLRFNVNPIYLKMLLGGLLITFLRTGKRQLT